MTHDNPILLILGGASPQQGLRCIQQAKSRGMQVWLTDTAAALEEHPEITALADCVTPLSYQDPEACVAWVREQARSRRIAGVFGFREYSVETVAAIAQELGLPGNPFEAVRCIRQKHACRQKLRELGFPQPASQLCRSLEEAKNFTAAHQPGPWIVKPPAAMGSQGVSLVCTEADWEHAMANLGESRSTFLVESFQHGKEFSAEGLFVGGEPWVLALTEKITTGAPHFVELGHTMPAHLDAETERAAKTAVAAAVRALGLCWGPFHVEFWVENGRVVLGEVHARPGGDYINYMTELVTGIELYGAVFSQFLGQPVDPREWEPKRGAAIRFVAPPRGRVLAVRGWESVVADAACQLAELHLKAGDSVKAVKASGDRPGFILATGATAEHAIEAVDRLCGRLQIAVAQEEHDGADR